MLALRKGSVFNLSLYDSLNPSNGAYYSANEFIFCNELRSALRIAPHQTTVHNTVLAGNTTLSFPLDVSPLSQKQLEAGLLPSSTSLCGINSSGSLVPVAALRRETGKLRFNPTLCLPGMSTFRIQLASRYASPCYQLTLAKIYASSTCVQNDIVAIATANSGSDTDELTVQLTNPAYYPNSSDADIIPLFDDAPLDVLAIDFYENNVRLTYTDGIFSVTHLTRNITVQLRGETIVPPPNVGCNVTSGIFYDSATQVAHVIVLASNLNAYYVKVAINSTTILSTPQFRQLVDIGNAAPYPHMFRAYGQLFVMYNSTGLLTQKVVAKINIDADANASAAQILSDSQVFITAPLLTEHYFDPQTQDVYYASNFSQFVVRFVPFEVHWQVTET